MLKSKASVWQMGVLYAVLPLSDKVTDWLHESGISVPTGIPSRLPTLPEIRGVLDSLDGFSVEYTDRGIGEIWQAMISSISDRQAGPWTLANISHRKDPSEPQLLWFAKGYAELIVDILSRLSKYCGVLVLIPDTGGSPLLISSGDNPKELCQRWDHFGPLEGG